MHILRDPRIINHLSRQSGNVRPSHGSGWQAERGAVDAWAFERTAAPPTSARSPDSERMEGIIAARRLTLAVMDAKSVHESVDQGEPRIAAVFRPGPVERRQQRPDRGSTRPNRVLHSCAIATCLLSVLLDFGSAAQSRPEVSPPTAVGIAWLILVDDLHMDFRNTGRIRDLLRAISTALMHDEDVVMMRASGPSSVAIGPTSDRRTFDAAAVRVTGNGLSPMAVREELKSQVSEIEARLALTLATGSTLLDGVPASPNRRTAMLYITNGYDSERGRALASLFSRAAQQAQVIVFTVNASGLRGSVPIDGGVDTEFWKQVVSSRRQSLRALAEPTGGNALLDEIDVADAMSRIRAAVLMPR